MFLQTHVEKEHFPLFQTASWSFCYPYSVLTPVHPNWSSRACAKIIELARSTGVGTREGESACVRSAGWVAPRSGGWEVARVGIGRGTFVRARKFAGSIQWHRGAQRARIVHRAGGSNSSDLSWISLSK